MTLENGLKAAVIGALASLLVWAILLVGIEGTGIAPFEVPPASALLLALGVEWVPAGVLLHFAWGIAGSLALVAVFREETDVQSGLIVAALMWLATMLVASPLIGWGPFGLGEGAVRPPNDPLRLEPGARYALVTLALHLLYGVVIGLGNALWCDFTPRGRRAPRGLARSRR